MTLRGPVPDALLCAYVDGALDAQTAADLATRALNDPMLAARIARLHGLKAGVAGLADALPPAPPLPGLRVPARSAPGWRLRVPGAALAAGLLAAAVLLTVTPAPPDRPDAAGVLGVYHDAWAHSPQTEVPQAPGWLTEAMDAAGLRLVRAAALPEAGLMHMAFTGRNDCRISLFEQPRPAGGMTGGVVTGGVVTGGVVTGGVVTGGVGPGGSGAVALQIGPELLRASWQTDQAAFTLIARSMNAERFITIAQALATASTRRDALPDPTLIAGLRAARQPCLG